MAVACTQETVDPTDNQAGGAGGTAGTAGAGGTAGTGSGGTLAGGAGGTAGTGGGGTSGGTGGLASGGLGGGGTGGLGAGGGGAGGTGGSGGAAGGAGGAGGSGGSAPTVMFTTVSGMINMTCGVAACHGTAQGAHMPTLTNTNAQTLYQNLTTFMVPECGNRPLVDPGDPANSAILSLVQKDCGQLFMPANCGPQMDPCIPQADIDTLTDWIEGGAPGPT